MLKQKSTNQRGMAIVIMMIGISGTIMAIGLLMSVVTVNRIKAGTLQLNSTKAYFAAEAGAERILWELRKNGKDFSGGGFNSGQLVVVYEKSDNSNFTKDEDGAIKFTKEFSGSTYEAAYKALSSGPPDNQIRLIGSYNNEVQRIITMKY